MHSANCKLSIKVLVSAFFIRVCSLHISADICMFLTFSFNAFRARRDCILQTLLQNTDKKPSTLMPKSIQNSSQKHQKPIQNHSKSTKMVPGSVPKTTSRASRFHVFPPNKFLEPFWRHLGDVGRHLVPSWAPRGSQNREFWHQDAPKSQKMTSRMRHPKKYEMLIGFLSENMRF